MIGGVHTRRVVDRIGVEFDAHLGSLNATKLGESQIATLTNDASAKLGAVDADGIVRLIAHLGVVLMSRLDVRADATVPQQIHRGGENGAHQLLWSHPLMLVRDTQGCTDLRSEGNGLGVASKDTTTRTDQREFVVSPTGSRQIKQSSALHE